jgi:hypothetical protein
MSISRVAIPRSVILEYSRKFRGDHSRFIIICTDLDKHWVNKWINTKSNLLKPEITDESKNVSSHFPIIPSHKWKKKPEHTKGEYGCWWRIPTLKIKAAQNFRNPCYILLFSVGITKVFTLCFIFYEPLSYAAILLFHFLLFSNS